MKLKIVKPISLVFTAVIVISQLFCMDARAKSDLTLDDPVRLNDMVITLLGPSISDAVDSFYEPYLTIEPTVAPYYGTKIISIRGGEQIRKGVSNSNYTVVVEVTPYIGPHVSVGKDRIELKLQFDDVTVTKYEHLESHELPPNLQPVIKKPLP